MPTDRREGEDEGEGRWDVGSVTRLVECDADGRNAKGLATEKVTERDAPRNPMKNVDWR